MSEHAVSERARRVLLDYAHLLRRAVTWAKELGPENPEGESGLHLTFDDAGTVTLRWTEGSCDGYVMGDVEIDPAIFDVPLNDLPGWLAEQKELREK